MKDVGRFLASDNLGYIKQITATREEVMEAFEAALSNQRLGAGDIGQALIEFTDDEWETVRGWLKTTKLVMAGMFHDESVPLTPPGQSSADNHIFAKGPCRCPISVITDPQASRAASGGLPWGFVRAWDEQWGAYDYETTNGKRAVIYIDG